MPHIYYVFFNMYSMRLTIHIIEQFFGALSGIMVDFLSLNKQYSWDFSIMEKTKDCKSLWLEMPLKNLDINLTVNKETVEMIQQIERYRLKQHAKKQHGSQDSQSSTEGAVIERRNNTKLNQSLQYDSYIFDYA